VKWREASEVCENSKEKKIKTKDKDKDLMFILPTGSAQSGWNCSIHLRAITQSVPEVAVLQRG